LLGLQPFLTAWDAIGDLEHTSDPTLRVTGKWADLLPSIPEGSNYLWHTARGGGEPLFGWRTRYWTFLLKLAKDKPAWTLQAQPGPAVGPFHWRNRRLSLKELSRLQTLPIDYILKCNIRVAQRLLGNAVPSALAEKLGYEIRRQFFGDSVPEALSLIPERRDGLPPAIPQTPVPEKYRVLAGDHADHPGTGLGPRALSRDVEDVG
jgi:DNA (cytosine-5)-methyltransferase 1